MKLNLKRPLAFFDLETTGTMIGLDRIIEIAIIKMLHDGSEEAKVWKLNPRMPIPLETSLIHGFYDEDVKDWPDFKTAAPEIAEFIADSDLAGFNSNKFDIPMLMEEFLNTNVPFSLEGRHFVDVQNIFHQMEQRTLKAAYKFYCQKEIVNAHSAEADTRATMEVLLAQVERYADTEFEDRKGNRSKPVVNDIAALHTFTNIHNTVDFAGRMVFNDAGEECFNFGKHKGRRVTDVFDMEPSYYSWIMNGDFSMYTKRKLEEVYQRWNQNRPARQPQQRPAQQRPQAATQQPLPPKPVQPANTPPAPPREKLVVIKKEPAAPVNDDMLKMLADKFKKS